MQLAIAYNYKSRRLVVKEVLGYERCQMALHRGAKWHYTEIFKEEGVGGNAQLLSVPRT